MSAKDIANFKSVEAQRSNNPEKNLRDIFSSSKINPASYYRGRKLALGSPVKRQNAKIAAATKTTKTKEKAFPINHDGHMLVIVGTPHQVREALREVI